MQYHSSHLYNQIESKLSFEIYQHLFCLLHSCIIPLKYYLSFSLLFLFRKLINDKLRNSSDKMNDNCNKTYFLSYVTK